MKAQSSASTPAVSVSAGAKSTASPFPRAPQLLSEKLRERDVLNKYAGNDEDGW